MKEADYNREVNKRLDPKLIRAWKIIDDYQGGVPDNYYHRKIPHPDGLVVPPLFVEFKFLKSLPKRDTTLIVPDLSALQRSWLEELYLTNMRPKVVVGVMIGNRAQGAMLDHHQWDGVPKNEFVQMLTGYEPIVKSINELLYF